MNSDQLINFFQRAMQPLKNRVLLMIGRAVISAVKDSSSVQQNQLRVLAGESMEGIERFQEFGFSSNPPVGTEAIVVCLGGNRENMVVIATDNRQVRVKNLAPGEMKIYTDDGTYLHLKKNGQVELKTATKVLIDAPDTEFTGNVKIDGTLLTVGATTLQDTLLVQKSTQMNDTLDVAKDITGQMNIKAILNVQATILVQAGGYAGPAAGGPSAPMVTSAPIQSTNTITTSSTIQASNVTGGGTDMATIKSTFNGHTHPDGTPNSGPPNSSL